MDAEKNLMGSYENTGQNGPTTTPEIDAITAVTSLESETTVDPGENLMESCEDNGQNGATVTSDVNTIIAELTDRFIVGVPGMDIDTFMADFGDRVIAGIPDEIIPGIPFHLTLNKITPKLSWMHCVRLFRASRQGQETFRNRLVYHSRVRHNCTESLAIFSQSCPRLVHTSASLRGACPPYVQYVKTLFVYSLGDRLMYQLPPIPGCYEGIPQHCQIRTVDGKLYVLGGHKALDDVVGSKEVYMLDLSGPMEWMVCASMGKSRTQFASAVVDGKIYVFGGTSYEHNSRKCEVYDPKLNAWTWIKSMPRFRRGHQIATAGNELFIYKKRYRWWEAEVYHTVNHEWRVTNNFAFPPRHSFAVHGRYLTSDIVRGHLSGIDVESGRFSYSQKYSYATRWEGSDDLFDGGEDGNGLAVAGELLVLQKCGPNAPGLRLLQSSGFGHDDKKELVWSEVTIVHADCRLLCTVEL